MLGKLSIEVYDNEVKPLSEYEDLRNIQERLWDIGFWIGTNYVSAKEYSGNTDSFRYQMIIDDSIVREEVYFFDKYIVINNKEITYPQDAGPDIIFR